jgi:hypothetical protein
VSNVHSSNVLSSWRHELVLLQYLCIHFPSESNLLVNSYLTSQNAAKTCSVTYSFLYRIYYFFFTL